MMDRAPKDQLPGNVGEGTALNDDALESVSGGVYIEPQRCIGCEHCAKICPVEAIVMRNYVAVIDQRKCIRCYACREDCPVGAVSS